jgi:hypothetical protein
MARLCAEFCYYPLGDDGLPPGFDVHHVNFDKLNYCHCNLLLIETALHSAMDQGRRAAIQYGGYQDFEGVD